MLIFCPNCNSALPERFFRRPRVEGACPACAMNLAVTLFPALFRPRVRIDAAGLLSAAGEASCYEHPNKRAASLCRQCGRFLCALCEVEVSGEVWCPACLTADAAGAPIPALEKSRTLFDSMALALATIPLLLFVYPSIFSAPVVLYLAVRYWNRPSSIVPRGRWRFVVAVAIVLVELGLIALAIFAFLYNYNRAGSRR